MNERRLNGEPVPPGVEPPTEEPDSDDPTAFALEAHLRDYIAANLSKISINSSKVDLYKDSTGRSGVEYPTGVGPIDILGVDSGGSFYVFELKVGRGPDKALGQLARYMGWVKINLAKGKDVVGVIVANSIDQKLRYAAHVFPGVTLLEYELAFSIRGVAAMSTPDVPDKGASSQL